MNKKLFAGTLLCLLSLLSLPAMAQVTLHLDHANVGGAAGSAVTLTGELINQTNDVIVIDGLSVTCPEDQQAIDDFTENWGLVTLAPGESTGRVALVTIGPLSGKRVDGYITIAYDNETTGAEDLIAGADSGYYNINVVRMPPANVGKSGALPRR